jgi:hypothetical protein
MITQSKPDWGNGLGGGRVRCNDSTMSSICRVAGPLFFLDDVAFVERL